MNAEIEEDHDKGLEAEAIQRDTTKDTRKYLFVVYCIVEVETDIDLAQEKTVGDIGLEAETIEEEMTASHVT